MTIITNIFTSTKNFFLIAPATPVEIRRKTYGVFLLGFIFPLFLAYILPLYASDVIRRYIPMAEAFALGEFNFVSHPRFPYLFQSLAGILVWCKIPASAAFPIVSSAALGGICVLIYLTGKRLFNHASGMIAVIIYLFCSRSVLLSSFGLREPLVGFGYFLIAYGAIIATKKESSLKSMIYWIAGGVILTNTRAEGFLISGVLLGIMLLYDLWRFRAPCRTILIAIVLAISILPTLYNNYNSIGYPVPGVHVATVLNKTSIGKAILSYVYNPNNKLADNTNPPVVESPTAHFIPFVEAENYSGFNAIKQAGKGLGNYIIIPVFLLFLFRIKNRTLKPEELIIAGAVALYILLVCLQMIISGDGKFTMSRRYLSPAAPLIMPLAGFLVWKLHSFWQQKYPNSYSAKLALTLAVVVCLGCVLGDIAPTLPLSKRRMADIESIKYVANVIKNDFAPIMPKKLNSSPLSAQDYHNLSRPVVKATGTDRLHFVGFLCGGQYAFDDNNPPADYIVYGNNDYDSDELAGYVLIDSFINLQQTKIRIFRRANIK